ncbi:acyl-phosphate glycerol 3-phosphate acyltransferase [Photobacterium angustum]|uniref:1-acyl-sn-glycerol-3-phosphate acyltransferase n=1 Tax=Photobacterium angustum TaxID=661 RepID=A0ABX5H5R8_PHOAN|nr:lysophospholipid acyltransferase family protein [Photobacterium angustum]KJG38199.1 acyl-phosphate glycerol 3-phosphate acyltransferase [Photobacterium angustum]PSX11139.1 1-acyl-sn-glycerol-3-phosphate acyltransferase [Photobacterium angustum]
MTTSRLTLSQQLNKYWRILATGFCFSLFGIGALTLTFIIFPLMTRTAKNTQQREFKIQKIIQQSFDFFCRTMRFWGTIDYRFENTVLLESDRNCLIVANHPSLIDYVLIASRLPQCDCLVKAAIWRNPFMKGIVKAAGYIPNRDPESLLDGCSERLGSGNVLLVFPEGTRTTPGKKSKLQRGAAQIAVRTASDLRVIHITVEPSFLTKEKKWYQVPDSKPFFLIEVKDKIEVGSFIESSDSATTAARKLNRYLDDALFPAQHTVQHHDNNHK